MIKDFFKNIFQNKRIGIVGFGREGISSYNTIRKFLPEARIVVLDLSELTTEKKNIIEDDSFTKVIVGSTYLQGIFETDLLLKSPGIPFKIIDECGYQGVVYSQTGLFLKLFRNQVVGVTGTKGKSTTASLIHHILMSAGRHSILAGNIGVPPFEVFEKILPESTVVLELSSHQLENLDVSPRIALLLNIFEEHLDHYRSYEDYQMAKANIFKFQSDSDFLIMGESNKDLKNLLEKVKSLSNQFGIGKSGSITNGAGFLGDDLVINDENNNHIIKGLKSRVKLPGDHNLINVSAASLAAIILGITESDIELGVASFNGLPHRLEFVGMAKGVKFYNDSISTIPQATIEALKAFPETSTLIVGGFDRGIDYSILSEFLPTTKIKTLVFVGMAGKRIHAEVIKNSLIGGVKLFLPKSFEEGFEMALENTNTGETCLLSPAASSYDEFKNFEYRGDFFKTLVKKHST